MEAYPTRTDTKLELSQISTASMFSAVTGLPAWGLWLSFCSLLLVLTAVSALLLADHSKSSEGTTRKEDVITTACLAAALVVAVVAVIVGIIYIVRVEAAGHRRAEEHPVITLLWNAPVVRKFEKRCLAPGSNFTAGTHERTANDSTD